MSVSVFGPYRLNSAERSLVRNGVGVVLGSRALDILITLLERPGEVLSQQQLTARAWPGLVVEEGNLRVSIAGLRKALGDGRDGARYIANVPGRGYCFVAAVEHLRTVASLHSTATPLPAFDSGRKLPASLARIVGREGAVADLSDLLLRRRFVSIVGAGGMGKTTVAISVAHALLNDFDEAVYFVDLGALLDASLVSSAVAAILGVSVQAEDPLPSLLALLADRRTLIVLDSCEHVIEAAAALAERLYNEAPQAYLLTTSREALGAEGEHVHLLLPLRSPPEVAELTAAEAMATPAVQLFMERSAATGGSVELADREAPAVAEICRRLDGSALAIDLAGSQVRSYGIQGTADLLDSRFKLHWRGRRTALQRHQTLQAMLDWSYDLLSDRDRRILIRLSVFVGAFTVEAAQAAASDDTLDKLEVATAITSLVEKSLVWTSAVDGATHLRLLDTTRLYAVDKLGEVGESAAIARKHAAHYAEAEWTTPLGGAPTSFEVAGHYAHHLSNVRAALAWSFSSIGDAEIGTQLVARSVPLFLGLSLLVECQQWCELALATLHAPGGSGVELILREALAVSAMFTAGNTDEVRQTIEHALHLAEVLRDRQHQMNLLAGLHIFLTRIGDFEGAVAIGLRSKDIAEQIGAPGGVVMAQWMLGVTYHLNGDQARARRHCELGFERAATLGASEIGFFGYDHRIRALVALARTSWLSGAIDRAAQIARQAINEAERRGHPVNLCIAMIYSSTVFLWRGDVEEAEQRLEHLRKHAAKHSLRPYQAVAAALTGELAILKGRPRTGVDLLRDAVAALHAERHQVMMTSFQRAFSEGLLECGEYEEAEATITAALARADAQGSTFDMPDLLRTRVRVGIAAGRMDAATAELALRRAIQIARNQTSPSLELRSALTLGHLWAGQGRLTEAQRLVSNCYEQFSEGRETADLVSARLLLKEWADM